ncbi:MAG TPA: hypothetical protein VK806_06885, partial [Bacteroidia bacterium]|nr:hypothetical protein [Bacteroidia bacterium]
QADEHFQILEFANFKLGNSPAVDLPWEYVDKIRPGLQPFITYCFIYAVNSIGLHDPFIIAFLFRLIIGVFAWVIVCKLVMLLMPSFTAERGKKIFLLLSLFLWFLPYTNVRFSSENTATICFLWVLCLLLKPRDEQKQHTGVFLIIGFLLGLSFFFRFQMAFAIIGLVIWLLFVKKIKWQNWAAIIFSGLCASAICIYLDKWLYGEWVLTPYNYYYFNIVKHVAEHFGTFPWYDYFIDFFLLGLPLISLPLMIALCVGIAKKPKHLFTFVFIPFFLGHCAVSHKEMRFLSPMWFIFIYLAAVGIEYWIVTYKSKKLYTVGFKVLVWVNILMLLYRTLTPAQEAIPCFKYAYYNFKDKNVNILCVGEPLFGLYGLKTNFYKPAGIKETVFVNEDSLSYYIQTHNEDSAIVFQENPTLSPKLSNAYRNKRIYTPYPDWLLNCDFNGWVERSNIFSIYILYKKH